MERTGRKRIALASAPRVGPPFTTTLVVMSEGTNRGKVYFALMSDHDFDPNLITQRLGIEPSKIRRKADPRPKITSWELSSGEVVGEVVDVHALAAPLVGRLAPHTDHIKQLVSELDLSAVLQVVLHISRDDAKSTPAIGFDSATVKFLGEIGASIDVDTYRA